MTYIKEQTVKPKVQRTLDIIADEIDKLGIGSILLTHEKVAELAGVNKRTVIRHLQELEEKGFLFVDRYIENGIQLPNEYRVTPFPTGKPNEVFTLDSLRDDEYWNELIKVKPTWEEQYLTKLIV